MKKFVKDLTLQFKMGKKLIVKKGYTLSVDSWENDGDHNSTSEKTYESKEKAIAVAKFLDDCINPISNDEDDHSEEVEEYLKEHGEELGISSYSQAQDLAGDLLGWSEYYTFRVPNSITITYSVEDVYLETVEY